MNTTEYKILTVAGLFSNANINEVAARVFQRTFGVSDDHVVSMDLKGCLVSDAKRRIRGHLERLGRNVIILGHSAGGQLGTHFIDHSNVELVVSMCGPSHNPLDYPMWLLPKTISYLDKTLSNQPYHLPALLSKEVFGKAPPEEYVADSLGHLVYQLNFGGFLGFNPAPPKPKFGNKLLCVASTGDKLITLKSVENTARRLGGHYMPIPALDHFIQFGLGAERRMGDIAKKAREIIIENHRLIGTVTA